LAFFVFFQYACIFQFLFPQSPASVHYATRRYNWTRAWLNIMFFRASMDSLHGTASTKLVDWPRSECQLQPQPLSTDGSSTAVVNFNAISAPVKREIPKYSVKFRPFVLRPDNKILVEDGSSRDSSSTMLKVWLLEFIIIFVTFLFSFLVYRTITDKISARITP
jgi:hypothetical protein